MRDDLGKGMGGEPGRMRGRDGSPRLRCAEKFIENLRRSGWVHDRLVVIERIDQRFTARSFRLPDGPAQPPPQRTNHHSGDDGDEPPIRRKLEDAKHDHKNEEQRK